MRLTSNSTKAWPIPAAVVTWGQHWRIADRLPSGIAVPAIVHIDVNMAVTDLGSTLLHLALTNAPFPDAEICMEVLRYLIVDCGADVNRADNYGRTPLTMLVAQATALWSDNPYYKGLSGGPAYGVELLTLMFARGADADVLFTPAVPQQAGCTKWRLVHECAYGQGRAYLPLAMRDLLAAWWNATLPDSEGRIAGAGETLDLFSGAYEPSPHMGSHSRLESEADRRALVSPTEGRKRLQNRP